MPSDVSSFHNPALAAERRTRIGRRVFDRLMAVSGVKSVSLVGSFVEGSDPRFVSDIDTIVICDHLAQPLFEACAQAVGSLTDVELEMPGRRMVVNSTFGPQKFDASDVVVIHLMVYDVAGHREHVLKSPFTCYDWERAELHTGLSLAEVYPVLTLQPRDFVEARRGLANYMDDLRNGSLSVRRYAWRDGRAEQETFSVPLDARHRGEFALHIIGNLLQNYAKLRRRVNVRMSHEQSLAFWNECLPSSVHLQDSYGTMRALKLQRSTEFPADSVGTAMAFVEAFDRDFNAWFESAGRLTVVRHARTEFNDGTFLGQGRDPDIEREPLPWSGPRPAAVVSSPSLRAVRTAECLFPGAPVARDTRLLEQNYGDAEALVVRDLRSRFPALWDAWSRGEDPAFPSGENQANVRDRLREVLAVVRARGVFPATLVTHNVVIRCLLGETLQVPSRDWFKLAIPHLQLYEVLLTEDGVYPHLSSSQKAALTDALLAR